jgi:hypothetical protein
MLSTILLLQYNINGCIQVTTTTVTRKCHKMFFSGIHTSFSLSLCATTATTKGYKCWEEVAKLNTEETEMQNTGKSRFTRVLFARFRFNAT